MVRVPSPLRGETSRTAVTLVEAAVEIRLAGPSGESSKWPLRRLLTIAHARTGRRGNRSGTVSLVGLKGESEPHRSPRPQDPSAPLPSAPSRVVAGRPRKRPRRVGARRMRELASMTRRGRRRGVFEGPPRMIYRRTGARYFEACAVGVVANGVAVSGFGLVVLALYVDVSAGELALFAACSAIGYALEGILAAVNLLRAAEPARAWLKGERSEDAVLRAWSAAAGFPLALVRRPGLYVIGAVGAAAADLLIAALLDLPANEAVLLFPASYLLYLSSTVLRYVALDLSMRPLLEDIVGSLPGASPPNFVRVSLHRRLLATVPMVTWGTALIVAGLLTDNGRDLDTIGLASVVAVAVTAAVSTWLSFVLADAVSAPLIDLRDATRRLGAGDLAVRVPVVSTDETGELAATFNTMVAGLRERERLHEAL